MASALRKRLGRRNAEPDLKHNADDQGVFSSESASSQENLKPRLTEKKGDNNEQESVSHSDMSTTPPPSHRKLRSSSEKSARNISPSQSLLDRYKNRSAIAQTSTTATGTMSPSRPARAALSKTGKDTAFSEQFGLSSPESSRTITERYDEVPSDMEIIEGVEFEMMGKKSKAGQPPTEDSVPLLPPRSTRSQARRQQRADSVNSRVEEKGSLIPSALSIRKPGDRDLPRTPSPRTTGTGDVSDSTSSNSPHIRSTPSPTSVERAKGSAQLPKLSPGSDGPKRSSLRKQTTARSVLVLPPAPINPMTTSGYVWVSTLSSCSRPSEPWGWLKKWTCCQCAALDPRKKGLAAQTMVEQNVCSRMECGHERCAAGCRVYAS